MEDIEPAFELGIRKDFMLRDNIVFLNHGAYGSVPKCIHERHVRYLTELESQPDIWFQCNKFKYLSKSEAKVAEFMGVHAEDTDLIQSVTKAMTTILQSFPLQHSDAILITSLTYKGTKLVSYETSAKVKGAQTYELQLKFPITNENSIVEMYEEFLERHPDVKLAIIDHITSPTSIVLPVKRITAVCHQHCVVVAVDAAHVPGQLKVDIQNIDADFYTGNLHKWLFCPRPCAFIWTNPKRLHGWFKRIKRPIESDALHCQFGREGTTDDTSLICSADGIDYYNRIGGMGRISSYNSELITKGLSYLEEKWQTRRLAIPECMEAPFLRVIGLPFIPGFSYCLDAEISGVKEGKNFELKRLLFDRFGVLLCVIIIEGKLMARLSAHVYNTMEDFVRIGEAVLELINQEKRGVEYNTSCLC